MLKFLAILVLGSFFTATSYGLVQPTTTTNPYYGKKFYDNVLGRMTDVELKRELNKIVRGGHVSQSGQFDEIIDSCDQATTEQKCTSHTSLGYDRARQFIFGKYYIVQLDASNYGIQEMYCDRIYQKEDFRGGKLPAPGVIPDNTIINVEHTWPQSKFTGRFPKEMQKSDLHHLFPTDSKMNSIRGNTIFGEVTRDQGSTNCSASRFGTGTAGSVGVFEPPADHKGDVARALFYFSVRYDMQIKPEEEVILKKWHHQYPVDENEMKHNNEVAKVQGNRNPFIDHPELVDSISDF